MTVDLKKLNSYKGDFTREALVKQPMAKLYKLAYELGIEGDLPEDKNKLTTAIVRQANSIKLTAEPASDELAKTAGERVIEGPLSAADEAAVDGSGTVTGEETGEAVNLEGLEQEGDEEQKPLDEDEVNRMDYSLSHSKHLKALQDRVTALEKGQKPKDADTLHGHVDDLTHRA